MQQKPTETSYQNTPAPGRPGIFSDARQPQIACIYVAFATVAGALAMPYQDTTVPHGALLLPFLTTLVLLLNALLLRRLHTSPGTHDLRLPSLAYVLLAAASFTRLPLPAFFNPAAQWLHALFLCGYATSLVAYTLVPLWRPTLGARILRGLAAAIALGALVGALAIQQIWPVKIVELLLLAGALMLLIANSQRHAALESWITAGVAVLMLDYIVEPLVAASGSVPWMIGWITHLLAACALAAMTLSALIRTRRVTG